MTKRHVNYKKTPTIGLGHGVKVNCISGQACLVAISNGHESQLEVGDEIRAPFTFSQLWFPCAWQFRNQNHRRLYTLAYLAFLLTNNCMRR